MENAYKFQIVFQNSESRNERMISVGNDMSTEGNTLISDDDIDMLVVLRINSELMEFMRSKYSKLSRQKFNVTIVRSDGE